MLAQPKTIRQAIERTSEERLHPSRTWGMPPGVRMFRMRGGSQICWRNEVEDIERRLVELKTLLEKVEA